MKKLQKEFTGNYDKVGMNKFVQIKKENNVAIYQRFNTDGSHRSYEVFIVKDVPKGAPLPNGKTVEESYEQYPGANAFGKTAATAAVMTSNPLAIADDAEITMDIDTAGTGAKGLKVTLYFRRQDPGA